MIRINITQQDIDAGKRGDPHACPLALALVRRTGGLTTVGYFFATTAGGQNYQLSEHARDFVELFDDLGARGVKPQRFVLRPYRAV